MSLSEYEKIPFILILPVLFACVSSSTTPTLFFNDIVATAIIQTQTAEPLNTTPPTSLPDPTAISLPTNTSAPTEIIRPTNIPEVTANLIPTVQANGNAQVSFIDVGQGDAILIRSPESLFGLIDGGEADSGIVQYLQSQGVQSLDLVVASHPNSDHIGGLVAVLRTFPTARVVTSGEMHTTAMYENFLDAIAASKAEYIEVVRGNTLELGSLTLNVLNPGSIVEGDLNRNSVVLRMAYGNTTFLFTGDASNDTKAEMLAAGLPLSADILKVGHHGSSTSTSEAFLAAVHTTVAVYMAGKGNSYGHPSTDTLAVLGRAGVNVLGTDVNGTIVFTVNGTGYSFQSAKQGQAQAPPITEPTTTSVTPSGDIQIGVVSLTSPISASSTATLTIQTMPGAYCSITVYYKSGASQAAGLGPQTADASGQATWSWKVASRTTPGAWKIVVQSELGGKITKLEIPFEVQ